MKVIHFTNNLSDGAGKAAYRLHKALLGQGVESLMLVLKKDCYDDTVIGFSEAYSITSGIKSKKEILHRCISFVSFIIRQFYWKLRAYRWRPLSLFNLNVPFVSVRDAKKYLVGADIICLYSIQGFLSSSLIRDIYLACRAPIVWTPLDIEPLTGGCHFNNGCMRFMESCGSCPQLASRRDGDISRRIWNQKKRDLRDVPITFVAVSSWALDHIRKSSLFCSKKTESIFLGVDENIFTKMDKNIARRVLRLPEEKKIILFGAFKLNDRRKGAEYLLQALKKLHEKLNSIDANLHDSITLLTMGRDNGFQSDGVPFKRIHLGEVRDDRILSLIYQASDVLASPSVDDFGPMMINEVFMCDTPVVAFKLGVALDLIKSSDAGYLAERYDSEEFALGLMRSLFQRQEATSGAGFEKIRKNCRPGFQAKQYYSLFQKLKKGTGTKRCT